MNDLYADFLAHRNGFKYISKKRGKNGKWQYVYTKAKNDLNNAKDLIKGTSNEYDMNSSNYQQKRSEIEKSEEWQEILKRKDPEYFKRDANGNLVPDIDTYIVKKKHVALDALTDIGEGRKISVNKQDSKTVIAGLKDYINIGKNTVEGILGLGIGLTMMKIKDNQGSYDEQKKQIRKNIQIGSKMVNDALKSYNEVSSKTNKSDVTKNVVSAYNSLSDSDKAIINSGISAVSKLKR